MWPQSTIAFIKCKPSIRFVCGVTESVQFHRSHERLPGGASRDGSLRLSYCTGLLARPVRDAATLGACRIVATPSDLKMDNQTRSEISRKKAIEAALTILSRDGVGGLTFDSLSRESGISKGGLLHQFRTKQGVLSALLEHQRLQFEQIARDYMASEGAAKAEPTLAAQIAIYRAAVKQPHSVARAVLAALIESPNLLEESKTSDEVKMKTLHAEASDPDLALLRYFAASGIAFHSLLGLSPLSDSTRDGLFERLLDEDRWKGLPAAPKGRKKGGR
jgi:AcrR family transcriptional regulator